MLVTVQRGYVYRIYPSKEIKKYFLQCFGAYRKIYNMHVAHLYDYLERMNYQAGDNINRKALHMPPVTYFKKMCTSDDGVEYLYQVDAYASNEAKQNFFKALSSYNKMALKKEYKKSALKRQKNTGKELTFRDLKGLPKFHSKKNNDFSYKTFNQNGNIHIQGDVLTVPTAQKSELAEVTVPMKVHRPLPKESVIKNVTISMNSKRQFFASICVEFMMEVTSIDTPTRVLGLDYSQGSFFVDSEGKKANYPQYLRKMLERLAKEQRKLSRQVIGSNRWHKQRKVLAKIHLKVVNQRKDWLHKKSHALANHYDMIVVEDLNLRTIGQNRTFAKKQQDNGFGHFRLYLKYKLEQQGKIFLKASKGFASTQLCSGCSYKNTALKGVVAIGIREWDCPTCGKHHDRDINSAINLKQYGENKYKATQVA
jgi:putative transposase